ncbi:AMP-binding protein [Actinoplanes sp. TBRC 11911]|uniref:fatty acid CoA ligase family protein n=1 Tax=Actinoplanes sp. TBRC 11911 TaxID=2729386 RepID=UPI00145E3C52|nr:fatty acid CoA ligase family protein [Actinoplanes sp. TBRC 11911]NMO57728.1 AMP-binding protein [Actinoplanes sp. TBRC 11911]
MNRPYDLLRRHAQEFGDAKPALIFSGGRTETYPGLVARIDEHAARLSAAGIGRGTRTIVMVPVRPELVAVLFALFKLGAVPVVVDPGMGLGRMLYSYRTTGAEAFVGVPAAHLIRLLYRRTFRGLRSVVTVRTRRSGASAAPAAEAVVEAGDPLLIAFTTGSTGPAKGVEFTYELLDATLAHASDGRFGHDASDICLATSLSFGLTHLLAGATCVFPDIDYGRIARTDPALLAEAVERFGATVMFGSPALLDPLARHASAGDRRLRSLRRVITGGAPASPESMAMLEAKLAPSGTRITVAYGATEVVPITTIEIAELRERTWDDTRTGAGTCVGRPVNGVSLRVIRAVDVPLPDWSRAEPLPDGEIGEIVVSGPAVSRHYTTPASADRDHKIADGSRVWHRTGDVGRIDEAGRVWLCGRKRDIVRTDAGPLYTVQCEGVFDAHPDVRRSALVGVGRRPVVCIELRRGAGDRPRIVRELTELAERHPVTKGIDRFLFHPSFPVDPRHNAKIDHERLAVWAARKGDRR